MPEEAAREGSPAPDGTAPGGAGVPILETQAAWGARDVVEPQPVRAAAQPPDADGGEPGTSRAGVTPPSRRGGASRPLADVVVELGFMPRERVDAAIAQARAANRPLEAVLGGPDGLTSDQLARATAERFGLDHVDLTAFRPDLAAVNLIGAAAARRLQAVPIGFEGPVLVVAMASRRTSTRSTTSS